MGYINQIYAAKRWLQGTDPSVADDLTVAGSNTYSGNNTHSGTNTHSGANTFSGAVTFTGTQIEPVSTVNTSAFTLRTSAHAGKTLLLTSAAGSRHKRLTLARTSLVTCGSVFRIVNGVSTLTSNGISVIPTSAQKLNGSSRGFKSTSRCAVGGGIEVIRAGSGYYTRNMTPGSAIASSLVWVAI